ncbi:MAG TPA: hypothetical protein VH496_15885 [Mycobacterium sp.]
MNLVSDGGGEAAAAVTVVAETVRIVEGNGWGAGRVGVALSADGVWIWDPVVCGPSLVVRVEFSSVDRRPEFASEVIRCCTRCVFVNAEFAPGDPICCSSRDEADEVSDRPDGPESNVVDVSSGPVAVFDESASDTLRSTRGDKMSLRGKRASAFFRCDAPRSLVFVPNDPSSPAPS